MHFDVSPVRPPNGPRIDLNLNRAKTADRANGKRNTNQRHERWAPCAGAGP